MDHTVGISVQNAVIEARSYAGVGIRWCGNGVFKLVPGSMSIFPAFVQTELVGNVSIPLHESPLVDGNRPDPDPRNPLVRPLGLDLSKEWFWCNIDGKSTP